MDEKTPRAKVAGPISTNPTRMDAIKNPPLPGAVGLSPGTVQYDSTKAKANVATVRTDALRGADAAATFRAQLEQRIARGDELQNMLLERITPAPSSVDMLLAAGDTATFGQSPVVSGLLGVAGNVVGWGDERPDDGTGWINQNLVQPYNEGFGTQRDAVLAARERNGLVGNLFADVTGGLMGAPGMLDKAITEGVLTASKHTGKLAALGRVVRDGLSGAGQAILQTMNYADEDATSFERLGTALVGFVGGAGAQAVLGDNIIPNLMTSPTDKAVAGMLLNRGPLAAGGRAGNVADAVEALVPGDGLADTMLTGFGKNNILIRGANALNQLNIPDLGDVVGNAEEKFLVGFYRAKEAVEKTLAEMNADATQRFGALVADVRSPNEVANSLAPRSAPIKREMSSYSVTELPPNSPPGTPLPKGATPVNMLETSDRLRKQYLASLQIKDESASPGAMKAWNAFNDLIRTKETEVGAGGLRKVASDGEAKALDDRVLSTTSNLATLYNARTYLAQTVQPGVLSTPAERMHAREVFKLLDIVDEEIAVIAGKGAGEARAAYAKIKAIEDMDMIGAASYNNRGNLTDPQARRFYMDDVEAVKDRIGKDPELLAAFQNGAKRAMRDDVGENGFVSALTNKLGTVGNFDNPSFLTSKSGALDELTWMFGDRHMRKVVDLFNTSIHGANAMERLSENLGYDNLARAGAKFDQHVSNDAITAAASTSHVDKAITYMLNFVKFAPDSEKMMLLLETMGNSPDAARRIGAAAKTLARKNVYPLAGSIGSALAAMASDKNRGTKNKPKAVPTVTGRAVEENE